MHNRFDRDQHESLIRQLFHVKQISTVSDYLARFTSLVDQLNAYSATHDQLYFTMCFVDGLHHDIKYVVMLQRPKDLDTAATLALLQEEVAGTSSSSRAGRAGDWSLSRVPVPPRSLLPLPLPPRQDKPQPAAQPPDQAVAATLEGPLSTLKSYHRAQGLCFKCGAKWSKDYKCSLEVLLAVKGIWDSIPDSGEESDSPISNFAADAHIFLAMSKAASGLVESSCAICFTGSV